MVIKQINEKKAIVKIGKTELFFMETGDYLSITSTQAYRALEYKKGSLSARTARGLKTGQAIKDIIKKAKGSSAEIILIEIS